MKNDDIHNLMDQVFKPKTPTDIVKGVAFYQGTTTIGAETKYKTLVAMVILSDKPIATEDKQEIIFMGAQNDLVNKINSFQKFKPPHALGTISSAITQVSDMSPKDLEKL